MVFLVLQFVGHAAWFFIRAKDSLFEEAPIEKESLLISPSLVENEALYC